MKQVTDAISIEKIQQKEREKIEKIIKLLETTAPLILSKEEKSFLDDPAEILWGSLTKSEKDLHRVNSSIQGERALEGRQEFGPDIQLLFIEPNKFDQVRSYVQQHLPSDQKVHIMTTKVIPFLHAYQMEHNEHCSYPPSRADAL